MKNIIEMFCLVFVVDGNWFNWGFWSECMVMCGGGKQIYICSCINFLLVNKGLFCIGESEELWECNIDLCGSKRYLII